MNILNAAFQSQLATLLDCAEKLHLFRQEMEFEGHDLPGFLYLSAMTAEVNYSFSARRVLGGVLGPDGWRRESAGNQSFNWTKMHESGVLVRILDCEIASHPTLAVPAEAFN